jgi:hypothetical protein
MQIRVCQVFQFSPAITDHLGHGEDLTLSADDLLVCGGLVRIEHFAIDLVHRFDFRSTKAQGLS